MTEDKPTILIIEDETPIRRFLRAALANQEYRVVEAVTAQEGEYLVASQKPDLILLDLGLPDLDGQELIRSLREWSDVPVIVVSARDKEDEKIKALDAGADDYLTKPLAVGELLARIRVCLRHAGQRQQTLPEPVIQTGKLSIDLGRHLVFLADQEVHLTQTEYRLLAYLARHAGKVVTHRQLLKEIWGTVGEDQAHYPRIYVQRLRHKLEPEPSRPMYLKTEIGVGYRLQIIE